jgi:hypothetical protein
MLLINLQQQEQERLADTTGRVPTTPQRPTVSGGQRSASSLGARISNPERYEKLLEKQDFLELSKNG